MYVGSDIKYPVFKPVNWSVHERVLRGEPITTNIVEGWNRGFNNSFDASHPDLNTFVCEIRSRDFLVNESILKHISEFKKIEKTEKS
jgi:hypothetical protein